MNNAAEEIVILSDALEALRLRTEELEQKLDTTAQPLAAASAALGGALDGIKALQFHVRDSNLGTLSSRIDELRGSVAEKIAAFSTQLVEADKRLESEQRQNVDGLRVELGAIGSAVAALSEKFGSELARIETDAKAEIARIEQIKMQVGPEGRSLNPRGTFVDGETYNRLDVVSWLGSSYIATVDGVTEKPSRNSNQWQVLASRGGGAGGVGDFASLAGVAQINQGGTGQTTRAAGLNALLPDQAGATQYMLLSDGAGNVSWGAQPVAGLPSQTGNSGKLLTTNGTTASWGTTLTTLSVTNGISANEVTCTGGYAILRGFGGSADTGALYLGQTTNNNFISSNLTTMASYIANTAITSTVAAGFRVLTSTASTSTSTGALVVSGGVGVAGAVYAGGKVVVNGGDAGAAQFAVAAPSNTIACNLTAGSTSNQSFGLRVYAGTSATDYALKIRNVADTLTLLNVDGAGTVSIGATTASTSTSTGALVCSGGVGVGGSVVLGVNLVSTASDGKIQITGTGNTTGNKEISLQRSDAADSFYIGLTGSAYAGVLTGLGNNEAFIYNSSASAFRIFLGTAATNRFDFTSSQFKINPTTASTSTSTGALVVSGGVGVAGAINVGGNATVTGTLTANGQITSSGGLKCNRPAICPIDLAPTDDSVFWRMAWESNAYNPSANRALYIAYNGATTAIQFETSGVVKIPNTTASTSTSTGALVVGNGTSGGLGVAGPSWFGSTLVTVGTLWNSGSSNVTTNGFNDATTIASNVITIYGSTGSNNIQKAGKITTFDGGSGYYGLSLRVPTSAYPDFSGTVNFTDALTLTSQLATFATAIKTAAPSGGTAANWKLGTVASVSPTSPNRTIEVDIGGTIYYIHAKTTNN